MAMPGRTLSIAEGYRYLFNGKEQDPEVKGEGAQYDNGFRIYDPRVGRFLSVDPLTRNYPMLTPYQFGSNRPIDGIDLGGLEYVSFHHYANGKIGVKMHYKSTDKDIEKIGGTTKGRYNSASYGLLGKGVVHYFYNADGKLDPTKTNWEQKQEDFESDATFHGLYSGPGSVTKDGLPNSTNYNFDLQPIDWADAIAKKHDNMDYADATKTGEKYAGYLEDIRTVQADRDMVARVDQLLTGALNPLQKKNKVDGVETPYRTSTSGEMVAAASGQRILINALAVYKQWKIDKGYTNLKKHTYLKLREEFAKDHSVIDKVIMGLVKPKK